MSNFHSDKNSSQTSTDTLPFNKNGQRNGESAERMRRLIPYMTFYIPTSNREYLPTSPYGPINNKPMVILQIAQTKRFSLRTDVSITIKMENLERKLSD